MRLCQGLEVQGLGAEKMCIQMNKLLIKKDILKKLNVSLLSDSTLAIVILLVL